MKHNPEVPNFEKNINTKETSSSQSSSRWSVLEKLADKYNDRERGRVNKIKEEIKQDPDQHMAYYGYPSETRVHLEQEKIDTPPSTLRKIGRLALDSLGIHSTRSEDRRDREAISVALNEHETEYQKFVENERQHHEQELLQEKRRSKEEKKEKEDAQFIEAMDKWRTDKEEHFQQQRINENEEKILNSNLLSIDQLETAVLDDNPEVQKREEKYKDDIVSIYTLKGFPFDGMLTHDVNYKNGMTGGADLAQSVTEDPSFWTKKPEDVPTGSDNICASYINSERLFSRSAGREKESLRYGFSHVDAGSLLLVAPGDRSTSQTMADDRRQEYYEKTLPKSWISDDAINALDRPEYNDNNHVQYNQIVFKRYDEHGKPHNPDYIITEDGVVTDTMLKHAAFFNIPIVNIDTDSYERKN